MSRNLTLQTLEQDRENDIRVLADRMGLALALRTDREFRLQFLRHVGVGADEKTFVFFDPNGHAYLLGDDVPLVDVDGLPSPEGRERQIIGEMVRANSELLAAAHRHIGRAKIYLRCLDQSRPNLDEFRKIAQYADIVGPFAYRAAARTNMVADELRRSLMKEIQAVPASALRKYWALIHSAAHLSLVAASGSSVSWLRDAVLSFSWENWTPSFSSVRERTVWMTGAGASVAAVIGDCAIKRYKKFLLRREPVRWFDVAAGLVGIACRQESYKQEVYDIVGGMPLNSLETDDRAIARSLIRSVEVALWGQAEVQNLGLLDGVSAWQYDPGTPDRQGIYPAIAVIPQVVADPIAALYGSHVGNLNPSASEIVTLLTRAWGGKGSGRKIIN